MKIKYASKASYWIDIGNGCKLRIHQGFCWDGDTKVVDCCVVASGCHDLMYATGQVKIMDKSGHIIACRIPRKQADNIYRDLTNATFARIRHLGLRAFGWLFYNRKPAIIIRIDQYVDYKSCDHPKIRCWDKYNLPCLFKYIKL